MLFLLNILNFFILIIIPHIKLCFYSIKNKMLIRNEKKISFDKRKLELLRKNINDNEFY